MASAERSRDSWEANSPIQAEEADEVEETPEARRKWGGQYGDYNFAGLLYNHVASTLDGDQGFLISPLGISQALGLLLFAVGPKSAAEIDGLLFPKGANASGLRPRHFLQSGKLTYATVASLRPDVYIDPGFLTDAAELDSYVYRTHFARRDLKSLNTFLKSKSQGIDVNLQYLLDDYYPANRLLFFNVLEFEAQFSALLLILLPIRKASVQMVERRLSTVDVRKLRSRLNITLMNISLPKVEIRQLLQLREPLRKAGITTAFNKTTADLNAFRTELPLDDVIVFTKINIFSQGINVGTSNTTKSEQIAQQETDNERAFVREEKPLQFEALRPFIYAVVDSRHVYLMGRHIPTL
ncbi:hypothetical protein M5D96_006981 [Drosophila gunungcola]|uniref:Serpin domain-containing protein n=1 Tax=Drosophila gunungcola TaxID=103775 RepID=A0A9P9YME2_9MUSC|nr:hypothetical protein M5D96_006981 [Drosophila gunungcola]